MRALTIDPNNHIALQGKKGNLSSLQPLDLRNLTVTLGNSAVTLPGPSAASNSNIIAGTLSGPYSYLEVYQQLAYVACANSNDPRFHKPTPCMTLAKYYPIDVPNLVTRST